MIKAKRVSRWLIGVVFIGAGINHFLNSEFYTAIMPPYIPYHLDMVYLSGILEILGGIGVLVPKTQRWAGYGLIALLLAVFPANIYMAMNTELFKNTAPVWALYLRLPLQFILIVWVYWSIAGARRKEVKS